MIEMRKTNKRKEKCRERLKSTREKMTSFQKTYKDDCVCYINQNNEPKLIFKI